MHQHKAIIEFGVIGLGRFGQALVKSLTEAGKEVLALDGNESKIKQIRGYTENAFVVTALDKDTLLDTGIQNCGTVIVCIGEKVDVSILTTLNVISMGVPRVISKAFSFEQGLILEKIGAEVVYPENDMAVQLANKLVSSGILVSIEMHGNINISELKLTGKIDGKTVQQANLRQKYKLNIIALEHNGKTTTDITPDLILKENDKLVVVGNRENIIRFEQYLSCPR
ncbi:MAG: potassium channel family protein [Caldicoprobacterales bacterium]|jgi:trk system potassium uptake protein TrkA|nr:TrkA family potassium uptake protein [Clostridiales bacterium]